MAMATSTPPEVRWRIKGIRVPRLAVRVRYVTWTATSLAKRAVGFLADWWRSIILIVLLVGMTIVAWISNLWFGSSMDLEWWQLLAVYLVLVALFWAFRARKRVVVERFTDHRAADDRRAETGRKVAHDQASADGLATLLVAELCRLHELYRTVDEQRVIGTAAGVDRAIDAGLKAEDLAGFLQVVNAESRISVGPLQLPVGTISRLLGRIVQGPQISGSVHEEDGHTILVAQKTGAGRALSWRVTDNAPLVRTDANEQATHPGLNPETTLAGGDPIDVPGGGDGADLPRRSLQDMVVELACRIFTDLTLAGTLRWRAVWAFTEGLSVYRDCLPTKKDRILRLRQAERRFTEAISEMNSFDLALYNLGVVYQELGEPEAAESAFLRATVANPSRWQPYYAMGQIRFNRKDTTSVPRWCERVIQLNKKDPRAHDLLGLARRDLEDIQGAIESLETAVRYAWKEMRRTAPGTSHTRWTGRPSHLQSRETARETLLDLALAYQRAGMGARAASGRRANRASVRYSRWAESIFRQALFVDRTAAEVHFEYGKACAAQTPPKWSKALVHFKRAAAIASDGRDSANYWSFVAEAAAEQAHLLRTKAPEQYAHAVDDTARACESVFVRAIDVLVTPRDSIEERWPFGTKEILDQTCDAAVATGVADADAYLLTGKTGDEKWSHVFTSFVEDLAEVAKGDCDDAIEELDRRLMSIRDLHQEVNRWQYAHVAAALAQVHESAADRADDATDQAAWHTRQAADVYAKAIEELEQGTSASRWRGIRGDLRLRLASLYFGGDQNDKVKAVAIAEDALARAPLGEQPPHATFTEDKQPLPKIRAKLGKRLGEMYLELGEFERARATLEDTLLWHPDIAQLHVLLGECHWKLASAYRLHHRRWRSELWLAEDHLVKAVDLLHVCERTNVHHLPGVKSAFVRDRGRVHYWLGRVLMTVGDHVQAANHLRIAESALEGDDDELDRIHIGLMRAESLFKSGWVTRCEAICEGVIERCDRYLRRASHDENSRDDAINKKIPISREPVYLGSVLAMAYCRLALTKAHRRMSEDAIHLLGMAHDITMKLTDPAARSHAEATYYHAKGWTSYQLDDKHNPLQWLGRARSSPDAELHLHLALAYERSARRATEKGSRAELVAEAMEHLEIVEAMTLDGEELKQARRAGARLRELTTTRSKRTSGSGDRVDVPDTATLTRSEP